MAELGLADASAFVDELERQIRDAVLAAMPAEPSGELAEAALHDVLLTYGNWRSRFVHPHPRNAHVSTKLQASPKFTEHQAAVEAIVNAIEAGDDIAAHLSRGIKTAYVPTAERDARLQRRSDLDLLISDWGLHHLHLTTKVESDGFVERTSDLLFGAFTDSDAYLIGIYPHGSWALRELIEILVREWPGNTAVNASLSGLTPVQAHSEEEHLQLRQHGVATFVPVDGQVFMPGLGMTTAGTPIRVTMQVNQIAWALTGLRGSLDKTLDEIDAQYPAEEDSTTMWEPWADSETFGVRRGDLVVPVADLW